VCTCTFTNVYTCYIIYIIHNAARGIKNMLRSILHAQVAPRPKFAERVQRTAEVSRFLEFPDTLYRGRWLLSVQYIYIYIYIHTYTVVITPRPARTTAERRAPPPPPSHGRRRSQSELPTANPPTHQTSRTDPTAFCILLVWVRSASIPSVPAADTIISHTMRDERQSRLVRVTLILLSPTLSSHVAATTMKG